MSDFLELPKITDGSPAVQIQQIKGYLYRTVERLNLALNDLDTVQVQGAAGGNSGLGQSGSPGVTEDDAVKFAQLKSLIIKSADIVNAYYEKISTKLSGEYVAQSDFGTFTEMMENQLEANATAIEQFYTDLQQILTDIENVEHTLIEVNAHIKSGLLYYDEAGAPVYGLEIGQRTEIDGEEVFNKYARFTSEKLSFYDSNGYEVAYISDKKLYITHIEVVGSFSQGGFVETTLPDGSVVTKWVGGDS